MDEFSLIDVFCRSIRHQRDDVVLGIGDDAACLTIPNNHQLLVSCDTLVSGVHFLPEWDAYNIATKALMVNLSDIAAMAGIPAWVTLALTLQNIDQAWLQRFTLGLADGLKRYNVALIGGDTTRGALSMTLTVHGLVPSGRAVKRSGAKVGDRIYVSGYLGAAAKALSVLQNNESTSTADYAALMQYLHYPTPRVDLAVILQQYATSCIDLSDGLSSDLAHICKESALGACINQLEIPIHPLSQLELALHGGDDYELCFTINPANEEKFLQELARLNLVCYPIGRMELQSGLRVRNINGDVVPLRACGYNHFN
jgi:thiamine-monophosphate kinase